MSHDSEALAAAIRGAKASAARRGLTLWGYHWRDGELDPWLRPAPSRRSSAPEEKPNRRGAAAQGSLL
jgi:hypothetical protein